MMRESAEAILADLGFELPPRTFAEIKSVRTLQPRRKARSAVYALRFRDQSWYIGIASNDPADRIATLSCRWNDIDDFAIHWTNSKRLAKLEHATIDRFTASMIPIRNIKRTLNYNEKSLLDEIISPDDQQDWLRSKLNLCIHLAREFDDPMQRAYYHDRFERFRALPFARETIEFLSRYIRIGIPTPTATERYLWSVSCLPYLPKGRDSTRARVSLNFQEVCAVFAVEPTRAKPLDPFFVWLHVRSSCLDACFWAALENSVPEALAFYHKWSSGGADQLSVIVWGLGAALRLIEMPQMVRAIREFNLARMHRGGSPWPETHCFDLADEIFAKNAPLAEPDNHHSRATDESTKLEFLFDTFGLELRPEKRHPEYSNLLPHRDHRR